MTDHPCLLSFALRQVSIHCALGCPDMENSIAMPKPVIAVDLDEVRADEEGTKLGLPQLDDSRYWVPLSSLWQGGTMKSTRQTTQKEAFTGAATAHRIITNSMSAS